MAMQRYFADVYVSKMCKIYCVGIGILRLVIWITWHFDGLNFISYCDSQTGVGLLGGLE